jgi:hypothetical protein
MFDKQESVEEEALELYQKDPAEARKFLTEYTSSLMKKSETTYWDLFEKFLFELNNNTIKVVY